MEEMNNPYLEIEEKIKSEKDIQIKEHFKIKSFKGISIILFGVITLSAVGLLLYDIITNIISTNEAKQDVFKFKYNDEYVTYDEMKKREQDSIDFSNPYEISNEKSGSYDVVGNITLNENILRINIDAVTDRFVFHELTDSDTFWNSSYEVTLNQDKDLSIFNSGDYILCYGLPTDEKLRPVTFSGNGKDIYSSSDNKYSITSVNSTLRTIVLSVSD